MDLDFWTATEAVRGQLQPSSPTTSITQDQTQVTVVEARRRQRTAARHERMAQRIVALPADIQRSIEADGNNLPLHLQNPPLTASIYSSSSQDLLAGLWYLRRLRTRNLPGEPIYPLVYSNIVRLSSALLAHVGTQAKQPCSSCEKGLGPWDRCTYLPQDPGEFGRVCSNCSWADIGSSCNLGEPRPTISPQATN